MDTAIVDDNPNKNMGSSTKSGGKKVLRTLGMVLAALLLMGAAAYGGYWWRDRTAQDDASQQAAQIRGLQQTITKLKATTANTTTTTPTTACTPVRPNSSAVDNIQASITSGNTAALEGYMAASLTVLYAASDGIGTRTPAQAVSDVTSFIGNPTTTSWSFDIGASVLSSYGQGSYAKYFPGTALVAKSSDDKILSFSFDCNGKIATVFMSASENLLQ